MEDKTTKDVPLEMDPEEEAAIEMSIQETAEAHAESEAAKAAAKGGKGTLRDTTGQAGKGSKEGVEPKASDAGKQKPKALDRSEKGKQSDSERAQKPHLKSVESSATVAAKQHRDRSDPEKTAYQPGTPTTESVNKLDPNAIPQAGGGPKEQKLQASIPAKREGLRRGRSSEKETLPKGGHPLGSPAGTHAADSLAVSPSDPSTATERADWTGTLDVNSVHGAKSGSPFSTISHHSASTGSSWVALPFGRSRSRSKSVDGPYDRPVGMGIGSGDDFAERFAKDSKDLKDVMHQLQEEVNAKNKNEKGGGDASYGVKEAVPPTAAPSSVQERERDAHGDGLGRGTAPHHLPEEGHHSATPTGGDLPAQGDQHAQDARLGSPYAGSEGPFVTPGEKSTRPRPSSAVPIHPLDGTKGGNSQKYSK